MLRLFNYYPVMSPESGDGSSGDGAGDPKPPKDDINLDDPRIQKLIQDATEKAIAKTNQERDEKEKGLRQNKDDILKELVDAKQAVKDLEHRQRIETGDIEGVTKEIEARIRSEYEDKLKTVSSELDTMKQEIYTKNIQSGLDSHLNDLKVKSTLKGALKDHLLAKHEITLSESTGKLIVNGTPSEVFFKEWSSSEIAKDWITVAPSSGGGGLGGTGTTGKSKSVSDLNSLSDSQMFEEAQRLASDS